MRTHTHTHMRTHTHHIHMHTPAHAWRVSCVTLCIATPVPSHCSKNIAREYELFMLQAGEFDERMFLSDKADEEIGTPSKSSP